MKIFNVRLLLLTVTAEELSSRSDSRAARDLQSELEDWKPYRVATGTVHATNSRISNQSNI